MSIAAPGPESRIYRPGELNQEARLHLEAGFPRLWLQGEISNLARPASGHLYFTLKDARAQIRCALFRGNAAGMGFRPENGQEVLVRGRLSLYEPRGDYQLIADGMLQAGAGALQQAFEALKKKLSAEGLFDEDRKQPLPKWPKRISVVTSPSGAAIRDILKVLAERWPAARVRIYPSQVQGDSAPAELMRALNAADSQQFGDLIIIGRGGGSLEDLWAFNDEQLARTIATTRTPVISAVGHETDITIADLVADRRAPTPTAAAAAATPDGPALRLQLIRLDNQLHRSMRSALERMDQTVDHLARRMAGQHPGRRLKDMQLSNLQLLQRTRQAMLRLLDRNTQQAAGLTLRLNARHPARRIDQLAGDLENREVRLRRAMSRSLHHSGERLAGLARALNAVSPLNVLERGYAVIRNPEGRAITQRNGFSKGIKINILMKDFEVDAEVMSQPRNARLK
jgi:exodeoxyribonuclease VII large subunit